MTSTESPGKSPTQDLPVQDAYKYWAFISYSHKDDLVAARLHRSIERYVVPRRLVGSTTRVGPVPRRLFPIFRDKDELPSAASLPAEVRDALAASRNLIVVCSPNAVASKWVDGEILYFKQLGRSDRIFCFLADGEPGASERPESGLAEAFPASVRYELGPDGALSTTRAEPLAADVRQPKTPWHPMVLRLVAGLLGLDYDTLVKRDARARALRRLQFAALGAVIFTVGAAAWLQQHLDAVKEREVAALRQLTQLARGLVDARSGDLEAGVLLGIEAMHRADALRESPEAALQIVRDGASLLPSRIDWHLNPPAAEPAGATFSRDGRWVCALGPNGVEFWLTSNGKHVGTLPGRAGVLEAVCNAIPRLGTKSDVPYKLLLASIDSAMTKAGVETGGAPVAELSSDGRWLARADGPAEPVRLIDTRTGNAVREFTSDQLVDRLRFTSDGSRLIGYGAGASNVGAQDSGIVVWDRESGRVVFRRPFTTFVDALATAPDTHVIAVASGATVKIIDADNGGLVQTIPTATSLFGDQKSSLALSRQGRWLAFGSGTEVRVWHVPTGSLVARIRGAGQVNTFSPNGRYVLTPDGSLWGMNTAAQLAQYLAEQETAQSLVFAGQKPVLAHGSRTGPVLIWDVDATDVVRLDEQVWSRVIAMDAHARVVLAMNGTTLGGMQSARLWDIASGKRRGELSPGGSITMAAISPNAAVVALRVEGRGVVLYDAQSLKELRAYGAPESLDSLAFAPQGDRLILRGKGGETTQDVSEVMRSLGAPPAPPEAPKANAGPWELSITGESEKHDIAIRNHTTGVTWEPLAREVLEYAISGDGKRLATIGRDGQLSAMWLFPDDVIADACRRLGRGLSDADRTTFLGNAPTTDPCKRKGG
ncbi:MAG: TIR domain-containing protein [Caldimonas sp.]